MIVVGVDVGSVRRPGGFAWAALSPTGDVHVRGTDDLHKLAVVLRAFLVNGDQVALAWESPLSVPVPDLAGEAWRQLGRARVGEGNRSWSAGAGAAVLATGLAQLAWLCRALARHLPEVQVTTQPGAFRSGDARLLLAEALISADGKPEPVGTQDQADALAAAWRLRHLLQERAPTSDVTCAPHAAWNLAAAAALYAGLRIDPGEVCRDLLVAKAHPVTSVQRRP